MHALHTVDPCFTPVQQSSEYFWVSSNQSWEPLGVPLEASNFLDGLGNYWNHWSLTTSHSWSVNSDAVSKELLGRALRSPMYYLAPCHPKWDTIYHSSVKLKVSMYHLIYVAAKWICLKIIVLKIVLEFLDLGLKYYSATAILDQVTWIFLSLGFLIRKHGLKTQ